MTDNIYPTKSLVTLEERQALYEHQGAVFWITGLPASGKTTFAYRLEKALHTNAYKVIVLDGDNMRDGLCSDLGFAPEDRTENIRRVAEVARLLKDQGFIVICSLVSPLQYHRCLARHLCGLQFFEVYMDVPLFVCRARDQKGLYEKAYAGDLPDFTGVGAPYEVPACPDFRVEVPTEKGLETIQAFCNTNLEWTICKPQQ